MFESDATVRELFCMIRKRVDYSEYDCIKSGRMIPHWEELIVGHYRTEEMNSSEWI